MPGILPGGCRRHQRNAAKEGSLPGGGITGVLRAKVRPELSGTDVAVDRRQERRVRRERLPQELRFACAIQQRGTVLCCQPQTPRQRGITGAGLRAQQGKQEKGKG